MSIESISVPLWDGTESAGLDGTRFFESTPQEIALRVGPQNWTVDYEGDVLPDADSPPWTKFVNGNPIIEILTRGDGAKTVHLRDDATQFIYYEFPWTADLDTVGVSAHVKISPIVNSDGRSGQLMIADGARREDIFIYPDHLHLNSNGGDFFFTDEHSGDVELYISVQSNLMDIYIKRNHSEWEIAFSGISIFTVSANDAMRFGQTTTPGIGDQYYDFIRFFEGYQAKPLLATSPSPATTDWAPLPVGSVVDMSTIVIGENLNDGDVGSIKYQYASNNGALNGTWLAQAQLRAETDITITDAVNSFMIIPQYISSGVQDATTQAAATVGVDIPLGSVGGGVLINGGLIN